MGYRNYIYVCDKEKLKEIEDMTVGEFAEKCVFSQDEPYFDRRKVLKDIDAKEVFEFGKDVDWTNKIEPYMSNVFKNEELHKKVNQEEEFIKLDYDALKVICNIFKQKILKWFKGLSEEENVNVLQFAIKSKVNEWETMETEPYNKYQLASSWKYEYEYFSLLHIMTQIDPEKEVLLWLGW